MTEAEQERARVVAWLRTVQGRQLTWRERFRFAWCALRWGDVALQATRLAVANFIERGAHLKENDV